MEEESTVEYKTKITEKDPKWYGPYEVAERKDNGNGNYLLKAFSGKNKGQISKKSYPPNYLKKFIHRNPEISDDSDSEYGSDMRTVSQHLNRMFPKAPQKK